MSAADYLSLCNAFAILIFGFILGQLWRAVTEFKNSVDGLIKELSEQGLLPPKKQNGKGRYRGTHV